MTAAVRVVVVEDSPVQRARLVDPLQAEGDVVVVGEAGDAAVGAALVRGLRPDVVTIDLGLPGEGGLGAIERIMAEVPTPILVLSARVTGAGSAAAMESLLAGAVEALPKLERWDAEAERQLRRRVRVEQDNLTRRFPFQPGRCQLVFCRNVLIYLARAEQAAFLERLAGWLAPEGMVFLGYTDSTLVASGEAATAKGDLGAGVAAFRGAVFVDPEQPTIHFQLGRALEAYGDGRGARRAYAAALAALDRCDPHAVEARLGGWLVSELAGVVRAKLGQPASGRREP